MHFAANHDLLSQIRTGQRLESIKDALPTSLPVSENFFLTRLPLDHKLHIAIASGLFAVSSEKVGPARQHIAGHVLHDRGNTICFFIEGDEQFAFAELVQSFLRKLLVSAEAG